MPSSTPQSWHLVADIGGTNARFARKISGSNCLDDVYSVSVSDHAHFQEALAGYLDHAAQMSRWQSLPDACCFAVACRVDADEISLTNSPWQFTRDQLRTQLGGASIELINDFAAKGYGIPELRKEDWQQVGGDEAVPGKPSVIIGPGTGLGVSLLVPTGNGFAVVDGEGGHVDFAPVDAQEYRLLEQLSGRFGRVSVERLLSGAGILNIYQALGEDRQQQISHSSPEQVTAAAGGEDLLAQEALACFCRILGAVAGNLALTAGALGGVYITGGIISGMLAFFEGSEFRHRFEDKGRFRDYLQSIPVRVVTRGDLGLLGAANRLTLTGL